MRRIAHPDQLSLLDGKVCKTCGIWRPLTEFHQNKLSVGGRLSYCRLCKSAYDRAYRERNRERLNKQQRDDYYQNYDFHRERARRYNQTTRTKETRRERDARERDRIRAYMQRYRQEHKDRLDQQGAQWDAANRERCSHYVRLAKARRRAAGEYSLGEWKALCAWFGNVCLRCGCSGPLTVDHVRPIVVGGSNTLDNLQPLCRSCNSKKGTSTIDYRDPDHLAAFLEVVTR